MCFRYFDNTIMKNFTLKIILLLVFISTLSSCKLKSTLSASEFSHHDNLECINGSYFLTEDHPDSLYFCELGRFGSWKRGFRTEDLVHLDKRESLKDKNYNKFTILYDGQDSVRFQFSNNENNIQEFIYKCEMKDNYLEIYFKKNRIWALPLFLHYWYDRLRLGLDENSDLIVHKWDENITALTIMPVDYFGNKDYSRTFPRLED